jgi:hypothetical protein
VADDFFMRGNNYNTIAKDGSIEQYRENAKNYNTVDFNAELMDAAAIKKDVGEYTTANTNGSNQIEITVNKMYPGYAQAFRTPVRTGKRRSGVLNKDNNDADSQEQSVKITMDLDWDQFNVGKDAGNTNILAEQNR